MCENDCPLQIACEKLYAKRRWDINKNKQLTYLDLVTTSFNADYGSLSAYVLSERIKPQLSVVSKDNPVFTVQLTQLYSKEYFSEVLLNLHIAKRMRRKALEIGIGNVCEHECELLPIKEP